MLHNTQEDDWTATQDLACPATQHNSQEGDDTGSQERVRPWGRLVTMDAKKGHADLIEDQIWIGRRKDCHITFDDLKISGQHCKIFRITNLSHSKMNQKGKSDVFLEDQSSNGTYINTKKIGKGKRHLLSHGDIISLVAPHEKPDCILSYIFQDLSKEEDPAEKEIRKFYDVKEVLGSGNFSIVKRGVCKQSQQSYAIKIIDRKKYWQSNVTEHLNRELEILKGMNHKNIIRLENIVTTEETIFIVMEWARGGELFRRIVEKGSHSEPESKAIFKQILNGVAYLHRRGIAHRDLKPENILLEAPDSMNIKITDFGLARIVGTQEIMTTLCGTPQYVAPEILVQSTWTLEESKARGGYGLEVDMWSLGAILYVLLSGACPFDEDKEDMSLFEQIQQGMYDFPQECWCDVSDSARDLVKKLLEVDPKVRLTIDQAYQHPWITGHANPKVPKLEHAKANFKSYKPQSMSPIKVPIQHAESDTENEEPNNGAIKRRSPDTDGKTKRPKKPLFASDDLESP